MLLLVSQILYSCPAVSTLASTHGFTVSNILQSSWKISPLHILPEGMRRSPDLNTKRCKTSLEEPFPSKAWRISQCHVRTFWFSETCSIPMPESASPSHKQFSWFLCENLSIQEKWRINWLKPNWLQEYPFAAAASNRKTLFRSQSALPCKSQLRH